jgi:predicted dinucleotide-binding enzyme
MDIAVLGTGSVGRALGARLAELGHTVTLGTRDPARTMARTEPDAMNTPPYAVWAGEHADVRLAAFDEAADGADLVVVATNGAGTLEALRSAGADSFDGTVLVDVTNPLDFSAGFPPTLFTSGTDSLGEQVQREFPGARVVKTLNTLNAELMVHPEALGEPSSVFVSGNDAEAKAAVTTLLRSFGHTDVIDLGDITTARGTESFLPLWLRLMGSLGHASFNIAVVRAPAG